MRSRTRVTSQIGLTMEYTPPPTWHHAFRHNPKYTRRTIHFRPIVTGQGSITEGLSKELSRIIQPTLGRTPYHLKVSEDLKDKIKDTIIPPTHKMVSFNITNMYTKIPRDEAIETIRNYLLDDPTLKVTQVNTLPMTAMHHGPHY
jgi:hypothetical protein